MSDVRNLLKAYKDEGVSLGSFTGGSARGGRDNQVYGGAAGLFESFDDTRGGDLSDDSGDLAYFVLEEEAKKIGGGANRKRSALYDSSPRVYQLVVGRGGWYATDDNNGVNDGVKGGDEYSENWDIEGEEGRQEDLEFRDGSRVDYTYLDEMPADIPSATPAGNIADLWDDPAAARLGEFSGVGESAEKDIAQNIFGTDFVEKADDAPDIDRAVGDITEIVETTAAAPKSKSKNGTKTKKPKKH